MTGRPGLVDKAHRLLAPRVAYLIGTHGTNGQANLIPVSNLTSVSTDPEQVLLAVHKHWNTHTNLQCAEGFTVSVPTLDQLDGVWKLGARYSGYRADTLEDKLATCGLALDHHASPYGPVLADGLGWLSARVTHRLDLGGDHGVFVGEVEGVVFDEAAFEVDGTPLGELRPVMQITGNRFTTAGDTTTVPYL